jgi:hypothetical protein
MRKYINKLFILGSLLFLGTSCENDAELTTLKTVKFPSNLEATEASVVLTEATEDEPVELFSWPSVTFPVGTPVTYSLQFDLITDITGPTAWQKAKIVTVGEDVLSKALLGKELNKIALDLGLSPDLPGKLVVRVEASLDHKIYSDPITLTVTPFLNVYVFGQIYMPGSYQGWNVETAAALPEIEKGIYQGYMTLAVGSDPIFKLNKERNWAQFFGRGETNADLANMDDDNFELPGAGSYQIKVNLNTLKWTSTPYAWGIVGPAQPGGWDNSTPMSYDHQTKTWKITTELVSGALKFRLNNSWTINYGPADAATNTVNLDNSAAYSIGEAGTYEVTFKIEETNPATTGYPATATCTIVKK